MAALASRSERFEPSARVRGRALVADYDQWYQAWAAQPDAFWDAAARELDWFAGWSRVSEVHGPSHRWFVGGKTNLSYNCLERNVARGRGHRPALRFQRSGGDVRVYSYRDVLDEASRVANCLRSFGIGKGDRVAIVLPTSPEAVFAMHGSARIGAVHSVLSPTLDPVELERRLVAIRPRLVVCADFAVAGGTATSRQTVERAVRAHAFVENVLVARRGGTGPLARRESDYEECVRSQSAESAAEHMDSDDAAFIVFSSSGEGPARGVVHVHGGYGVGVNLLMRHFYDTREDDVWWSASAIHTIFGHSCGAYGPLLAGVAQVLREDGDAGESAAEIWSTVERHGVTTMLTTPHVLAALARHAIEAGAAHDLTSLRAVYSTDERLDAEVWIEAARALGRHGAAVLDNYWQAEVAAPVLGTLPSMTARPGFAGKPMPGIVVAIVDERGAAVGAGRAGRLVVRRPVPHALKTLWGDDAGYAALWSETLGGYDTGDLAVADTDGSIAVLGRAARC